MFRLSLRNAFTRTFAHIAFFNSIFIFGISTQGAYGEGSFSVNYLLGSRDLRTGAGLTVLLDQGGKPVVTPIK